MNRFNLLRPLVLASLIALSVGVVAEEPKTEHKIILALKTADGTLDTLKIEGELALGEQRGYETEAGTPVLVSRDESGYTIETPEKTVKVPGPGQAHMGWTGAGEEEVVLEGDGKSKVIVMTKAGEDGDVADLMMSLGELDEVTEGEDGAQVHKIVIVKKDEPAAE